MSGTIMTNDPELVFTHKKGSSVQLDTSEFSIQLAIDTKLGVRVESRNDSIMLNPQFAVYGDSMAFGYGVAFSKVFSEIVNKRHGENTILNLGIYSYGPDQEYRLANRLRDTVKATNEVVLFFTGNDIENFEYYFDTIVQSEEGSISFGEVNDSGGYFRRVITNSPFYPLFSRLRLFHWVKAVVLQGSGDQSGQSQRYPSVTEESIQKADRKKVQKLVQLFTDWSNRVGKEHFHVVIIPHQKSLTLPDFRVKLLADALQERVNTYDYFDFLTAEELEKYPTFFYPKDAHWNEKGHEMMATVFERIFKP